MKVMVYAMVEGVRQIMVVPGRNAHLPPITIRGTDKVAVMQEVREVVEDARARSRENRPSLPG
ncbi:MAG: hypothetical protein KAR39_12630 [Thermoplasmata archaeon]|nr:hypothetical protein [Thermoplasmata archaeon]